MSDTPPTGVPDKSLWIETDTGLMFSLYNDGSSTQWIMVPGGIPVGMVRYDSAQTLTASQKAQAHSNIGSGVLAIQTFTSSGTYTPVVGMKAPPSLPGNFPAFWLLSATNRWPTEVDIYEGFGSNGPGVIHPVLHSDPYWPSWSNADDTVGSVPGSTINVGVDLTQGFHRIGVDVQPEGLTFYFDRKRVGNMRSIAASPSA